MQLEKAIGMESWLPYYFCAPPGDKATSLMAQNCAQTEAKCETAGSGFLGHKLILGKI